MPCSGSNSITTPGHHSTAAITCPMGSAYGMLGTASGRATTSCRTLIVRATLNGHVTDQPASPVLSGTEYITDWKFFGLSAAICSSGFDNHLKVAVQCMDMMGSLFWISSPTHDFQGTCAGLPVRFGGAFAAVFIAEPSVGLVASTMWALVNSKLMDANVLTLEHQQAPKESSGSFVVWKSGGEARDLWTMRLITASTAELVVSLPVEQNGQQTTIQQRWFCIDFSPTKGGIFTPLENVMIPESITVRAHSRGMPRSARKPTAGKGKARGAAGKGKNPGR